MKKSKLVLPLILAAGLTTGCRHHHHKTNPDATPSPVFNSVVPHVPSPDSTPAVLGYVNNVPITQNYIDNNITEQMRDLRIQTADTAINQYVLQQEASKEHKSLQDYVKSIPSNQLLDKVYELRKKYNAKMVVEPTRYQLPDLSSNPTRGPKDAPVNIVEFADFQCPYCKVAEPVLQEVQKVYGKKVSLTYMYFPLPFHEHAMGAAKAAFCADKEGKFWEMHDYMYNNQDKLTSTNLENEAVMTLGMDGKKYNKCMTSNPVTDNLIQNDKDIAGSVGVTGTPTFFVNGIKLVGVQPMYKFAEIIDQELNK